MLNPLILSVAVLGGAVILLVIWIVLLELRISRLLRGGSGASLEESMARDRESIEELFRFRKTIETQLRDLDQRLRKKLHGAKTIRFNPFAGTGSGGNQSFATAFLDENGDGVVISSLYSREKVSVFAKPVENRRSEFELTEEEKEVLK